MKRVHLDMEAIVSLENLARATHLAARGKRDRRDVQQFLAELLPNLAKLRDAFLGGEAPEGRFYRFKIYDPKPRIIHAPCFEDRVIHHALMQYCESVLDRSLVDTTFACRKGKGTLAGVKKAQSQVKKYPWFAKMDVAKYFDSIDHGVLWGLLLRKFKGPGVPELFERILKVYWTKPGKGLPIGALTSQIFANYYLAGLDRFLLETVKVEAMVRYMDDVVLWTKEKRQAQEAVAEASLWLDRKRCLHLNDKIQINRSSNGVPFLGFRVTARGLYPNRRRKRRFGQAVKKWERHYRKGDIDALTLQKAYAGVHAILAHTNSRCWRQGFFRHRRQVAL